MKNKKLFLKFLFLFFCMTIPNLKSDNQFDGKYKSEFLLPFNRSFADDLKCPKKLPIRIEFIVENNQIIGNISNSSKCPNYQRAKIKGKIDNEGNISEIKFNHYDKKWGPKDDAYKILGNLNGQLILKSKQRRMYKDHEFFLTKQDLSNNKTEFIEKIKTNGSKDELEELKKRLKILEEEKSIELEEKERIRKLEEERIRRLKEEERIRKLEEERIRRLKEEERIRKLEEEKSKLYLY